jgi:hypothetical protein
VPGLAAVGPFLLPSHKFKEKDTKLMGRKEGSIKD